MVCSYTWKVALKDFFHFSGKKKSKKMAKYYIISQKKREEIFFERIWQHLSWVLAGYATVFTVNFLFFQKWS